MGITMSTSVSRAQELITCDLDCVKPVQQFCNSCQVGLCADCINKHVNSLKSMKHDIVPFTKRTVLLVFPQCTSHSHQRCDGHCQQCDVPVCIKCIVSPHHEGHDIEDMAESVARKKENIKREIKEIEKMISKNKANDANARNKLSKFLVYHSDIAKQTKDKRKIWHMEVDDIFDKFDSLIQAIHDQEIKILKSYQIKLRRQTDRMLHTVQKSKDILKSNYVSDVNDHKLKPNQLKDVPELPEINQPSLKTETTQGRELIIELREYKAILTLTELSTLRDEALSFSVQKLLDDAKEVANISTNLTKLGKVACVETDKAWFSGKDEKIRCVDIHGSVINTVTSTCFDFPTDITVNREGELMYSDFINRTIGQGPKAIITMPQGWHPVGLCCTSSDDILISTKTSDHRHCKIVRYQGQRVIQEVDKDERGQSIYRGGSYEVFLTENTNGDIVASDLNAKAVVVVDRTGKVRFRYEKPPGGFEPFSPRQIVTDSMGQIIVADPENACLHIIDQNGQFMKCVDNFGLNEWPYGLSMDSKGRLWVGSYNSGEVKVIQYKN